MQTDSFQQWPSFTTHFKVTHPKITLTFDIDVGSITFLVGGEGEFNYF